MFTNKFVFQSEELFDDLEEEFVIGAPKAKPKVSQMPFGVASSPVKKGATKKSAAEVCDKIFTLVEYLSHVVASGSSERAKYQHHAGQIWKEKSVRCRQSDSRF